jgi:hypothetical protein
VHARGLQAEDCQCCDALDTRRFNDSVEELIALASWRTRFRSIRNTCWSSSTAEQHVGRSDPLR